MLEELLEILEELLTDELDLLDELLLADDSHQSASISFQVSSASTHLS